MELSAVLSAVQSVANKLSLYAIESDVYNISMDRREVSLQGKYSYEFVRHLVVAKLDNFKQLPIRDTGFIEMSFTCEDIVFKVVLT